MVKYVSTCYSFFFGYCYSTCWMVKPENILRSSRCIRRQFYNILHIYHKYILYHLYKYVYTYIYIWVTKCCDIIVYINIYIYYIYVCIHIIYCIYLTILCNVSCRCFKIEISKKTKSLSKLKDQHGRISKVLLISQRPNIISVAKSFITYTYQNMYIYIYIYIWLYILVGGFNPSEKC